MSRNSIQVAIKVRPLLTKENELGSNWHVTGNTISLEGSQSEPYCFDHVFDHDASNQEIFEKMAKHIVHSAVHGFNGTIFAYGQTASGKTYTMMGGNNDPGVMVLAAKEIFSEIDRKSNSQFLLRGGFIEIYNEKIYDLLNKSNQDLKIHETSNGNAQVNCEEVCITSEESLLHLLEVGNEARTVGETNMNERSSRSHAIFRLIIESRQTDNEDDDKVTQSVLNLVDLAGSERADQTGARGARLKEGGHINKSLLFLSTVIKNLSENETVSYRNSKLTRILQASLGGNAFTSIICTVNPTSIEETQSTLNFALRAKTVKNKPHVNEIISDATMMKRLTSEIKNLRKELDDERRKNASQLKVAQIEKLLDFKELKFINSLTHHNSRAEKQNRRRTWCPESINTSSVTVQSTNPFKNELTTSRLKPPNVHLTPLVTLRDIAPEHKLPSEMDMDMIDEEFEPAEFFDFNNFSIPPPTTSKRSNVNADGFLKISLSPNSKNTTQHVKMLEEELQSLQEFGNLEKEVGVEHDVYGNLKSKLENMCKRNEILENERVEYLATKNELDFVKEQLISSEKCCDQLQIQITKLTQDKQTAYTKAEQYETELFELKSKLRSLEIESQQTTSLQFEIDSLRKKTKLREKELLEVLGEKDLHIAELENQLKLLKSDRLQFSREQLMQLTQYTTTDNAENVCSEGSVNGTAVCAKCEDLQRLLDESKKVTLEFDKLTLQYKELQENYQQLTAVSLAAQTRLEELNNLECEATKTNESEELRCEITDLRLKLENIERDYEALKCERDTKCDCCEVLRGEVELSQEQLSMLQKKYVTLEDNWRKQEENITVIKADYDSLEKRYIELKTIYENLEHSSNKCSTDCARLQSENDELQHEIENLKSRIEEMQQQLLAGCNVNEFIAKENDCKDISSDIRSEHDILKLQLKDLQTQYEQLQQEYDLLSTNVMETVQENDMLIAKVKESETFKSNINAEKLNWNTERTNLEQRICELQRQLEEQPLIKLNEVDNDSIKHAAKTQMPLMEHVECIELELKAGKSRTFTALDTRSIAATNVCYKLSLGNWKTKACEDVLLDRIECGQLEAFITCINDWRPADRASIDEQHVQHLQETIANLEELVRTLNYKNEYLVESTEKNLNEMREVIKRLTKELCEKSIILDDLVKERAEMTLLHEDLQLKLASSQNDINITLNSNSNSSCNTDANQTVCQETTENKNELSYDDDDALKAIKLELINKEEECNKLKLEILEKQELSENEFRSNLRKYNADWEQSRLKYKRRIEKLEELLVEKGIQISEEQHDEHEKSFGDADAENYNSFQELNKRDEENYNSFQELNKRDEENYNSFQERNTSSTPNTPPTSTSYSEHYLEIQRSRMELSQMVQGCNEQLSNLITAMQEAKEENLQLSKTLQEAEEMLQEKEAEIVSLRTTLELAESKMNNEILQEKEAEIESLRTSLNLAESKMNDLKEKAQIDVETKEINNEIEMSKSRINDLEESILNLKKEKEDRELEILKLTAEVETIKRRAHELEERSKDLEDMNALKLRKCDEEISQLKTAVRETEQKLATESSIKNEIQKNLTCLQSEYNNILEERNDLLARIEKLQSKLDEINESSRLVEAEKVLTATQKELSQANEVSKKLEEELQQMKTQQKESQQEFENMKRQLQNLSEVDGERSRLQANLIVLKSEFKKSEESLQKKQSDLVKELEECLTSRNELKEKSETLKLKMEAIQQELHESRMQTASLEKTLKEYEGMEKQLDEVSQSKLALEQEASSLRQQLSQLKDAPQKNNNNAIEELQAIITELQAAQTANAKQHNAVRQELMEVQAEFGDERKKLQRLNDELQSELNELKLKCDSLKQTNAQLITRNNALKERLSELECNAIEYTKMREFLQEEKRTLQARIETLVAENEKNAVSLKLKLEEQQKPLNNLRAVLHSKEAAFESKKLVLEGTIDKLQSENKNLLDHLEFLNEFHTKRTADVCESANNSLETSVQSQKSPLACWSPMKTMTNVNAEDKFSSIQKERKNRRLSTHDENRRQSAKFTIHTDASTQTDPLNDCECNKLGEKLKEIETQLFISQSQVTALNFELRNHPLKAEKLTLVKRIQEEQEKNRQEIKKYKTKISEQAAKIQSLIDQANIAASAAVVAPVSIATIDQSTCTSPSRNIRVVGTQTDMAIDAALQKLQGKYNDIKNICRFRYNRIINLEKMLEEKENMCAAANQQNQQVLPADISTQKRK